jgi:hypothetical protein
VLEPQPVQLLVSLSLMSRTSSIANSVLTDISTHLDFLPTPLHADFLPLPYIAALHAIRVSIAWRQVTRGKGSEAENEGMRGLVGYLVMACTHRPSPSLSLSTCYPSSSDIIKC